MSSLPVSAVASSPVVLASQDIDSTLRENRVFPPPPEFSAKAHIQSLEQYEALYKQSIDDPEAFWAGVAKRPALVQAMGQGAGVESPVCSMVCGRKVKSMLQLRGSPCVGRAPRQDRADLGG
jgi:hypothetical protein